MTKIGNMGGVQRPEMSNRGDPGANVLFFLAKDSVPFFLPMETKSEKGKKIACHINITATHAHTLKGLWAEKAMGKGQRGQGRGKGEGAQ